MASEKKKTGRAAAIVLCVLFILFAVLSAVLYFATNWANIYYDDLDFEQIIFNLSMPVAGVDMTLVYAALRWIGLPVLAVLLCAAAVYIPLTVDKIIKHKKYRTLIRIACWVAVTAFAFFGTRYADESFGIADFLKARGETSTFIEENYADPKNVKLTFPEKKRNLIFISMESIETTFTSREHGGGMDENLLPEMTKMMEENVSFSNTSLLGGAVSTKGASWTIASVIANSAGLPMKLSNYNKTGDCTAFLTNTVCLGDILKENGYNQALVMGSDSAFAGTANYYKIHGNQAVYDCNTAVTDGIITENYTGNDWGLYDKDLYAYAKYVLGKLSAEDAPFALSIQTIDTHMANGYPCSQCADFDDENNVTGFRYHRSQYPNALMCASRQVYDFVEWLKTTDYYENTTIIITGDHKTMVQNFYEAEDGYIRTPANVFINAACNADESTEKNRLFATLDMFPTTLAAMGVEIEGNRLGLGTNLFSGEKTLIEKYGKSCYEAELSKTSVFYNNMLYTQ